MPNVIAVPLKVAIKLIAFVEKLVISMLNAILRLFGMQMRKARHELPTVSTKPSDILAEFHNSIADIGTEHQKLMKATSEAGHILYRFARTCPEERASMDLSALTSEQQAWMLMLSDADLERLVKVGLDGCTRAMNGRRCGVGGLPIMGTEKSVETLQPTSPLARRILAYRQASFT